MIRWIWRLLKTIVYINYMATIGAIVKGAKKNGLLFALLTLTTAMSILYMPEFASILIDVPEWFKVWWIAQWMSPFPPLWFCSAWLAGITLSLVYKADKAVTKIAGRFDNVADKFFDIDTDGNGVISLKEFKEFFKKNKGNNQSMTVDIHKEIE